MDGFLYVASTGSNQIWQVDPDGFELQPFLGSGVLGCKSAVDGTLVSDFCRTMKIKDYHLKLPNVL